MLVILRREKTKEYTEHRMKSLCLDIYFGRHSVLLVEFDAKMQYNDEIQYSQSKNAFPSENLQTARLLSSRLRPLMAGQ